MTDLRLRARLIDEKDVEIVVDGAWTAPTLKPRWIRWCRACHTQDCPIVGHATLTFTATQHHADGSVTYRADGAWTHQTISTPQLAVVVIDALGNPRGSVSLAPPYPDAIEFEGQQCPLWCRDAHGIVQYMFPEDAHV